MCFFSKCLQDIVIKLEQLVCVYVIVWGGVGCVCVRACVSVCVCVPVGVSVGGQVFSSIIQE